MKTTQNKHGDQHSRNSKSWRRLFFKLWCVGAGVSMVGSVNAQNSKEDTNLLKNGSFELEQTTAGRSKPVAWEFWGSTNTYAGIYLENERTKAHSGLNAIGITSGETSTNAYATWMSDLIEVMPGTRYSVTGWIKTTECVGKGTGKGAWLWIYGYENPRGQMLGAGKTSGPFRFFVGTQDWQEWSVELDVSENIHWLGIACRLDGEGKAWFDDVSVSLVK